MGALLSAILFAAAFVFWTYYPHHLPLPTALAPQKPAVTAAPAAGRARRAGQAAQPGHRHHAARSAGDATRSAGSASGRTAGALGLRRSGLIDVLSRFARVRTVRESGGVA